MLHSFELEFIQFIHRFRTPLGDGFFKLLDFFDRQELFFILIPVIWFGHGWKAGLRLFYILLLSSLTNHVLKQFFLSPRPFHIDPSVGIIEVGGYGFPSGAAQSVILLSGLLVSFWKNSWKWSVVFSYILLVSFSRVYLGLHFPSDILGGWVVGGILLAFFIYVFPLIEKQLEKLRPLFLLLMSQFIPVILLAFLYSPAILRLSGAAMGMGIGIFIRDLYEWLPAQKNQKINRTLLSGHTLRASIGVFGTFFCYGMTSLIPIGHTILYVFFQFLLIGLWVSLGSLCLDLISRKFLKQRAND